MKKVFFVLYVSFLSSISFGQDCSSCDKYLDVIHDEVSIQKSEDFQQSFRSWFFSENFEKEIKNNKQSISIIVPYKGGKLTFGGNNESANVWETWQRNQNSTDWDFSKISKDILFTRIATAESRDKWLQCIEYTCGAQVQRFPVKAISNSNEAIFTFSYNRNLIESPPRYESFECFGGLNCSEANRLYKGKQMKPNGEAIKFEWMNTEDSEGGVIVNTTKGTTFVKKVFRNIKVDEGVLEYISETLGSLTNPNEIIKIAEVNEDKIMPGMPDVRSKDCYTGNLSPDGRRCANVARFTYKSAPEQIYKNLQYKCIEERGYSCGFSKIDALQTDGTEVWIQTRNWGPTSLWRISIDIYKAKTILKQETIPLKVSSNIISFNVPKSCHFPLITLKLVNNKTITFKPEGPLPREVTLTEKKNETTLTSYTFRVN